MWAVSDRWDSALRVAHTVATTAEVWQNGVLQTTLNLTGGTVTIDEGSKVRRTLALDCSDVGLEPDDAADLLSPFGTDLHVYSGITYTEGDTELVPVGIFRIDSTTRAGILSGLTIMGNDYSKVVGDDRFIVPWNTTAGSLVVDEVTRIVQDVLPSVEVYDLTGSQLVIPATTFSEQGSRWDAIESLVSAIGGEPIFDQAGRLLLRPVPTVDSSSIADWIVDAGNDTAVMTDVATGLSAEQSYNAVVATNNQAGTSPVMAVAYQTTGPLAWRQGYKRPRFYSSAALHSTDACLSAATAILARSANYVRQISPQAVPNPALDVGDIVECVLLDGTSELRVVSKIGLPLDLQAMSLDTRIGMDVGTTTDAGTLS